MAASTTLPDAEIKSNTVAAAPTNHIYR